MGYFLPKNTMLHKFGTRVSVSLRAKNSRNVGQRSLDIRIGRLIVDLMGWVPGNRIEVLWGQGPDFGKISLRKSGEGVKLRSRETKTTALLVSTNRIPRHDLMDEHMGVWRFLIDHNRKAVEVKHYQLPEGRLGIDLPEEWFEMLKPPKRFAVL
jgi:hypothetical protein